jgi:hypothetical protein
MPRTDFTRALSCERLILMGFRIVMVVRCSIFTVTRVAELLVDREEGM